MRTSWMLSSLLCMHALFAQDGAKPPTRKEAGTQPSIVLLLQDPLELEVGAWRRSWSDIVTDVGDTKHEKNPWLRAEGDTLFGGWEGVQFVVRSSKEPRTLADWQVRHMFEEVRAELRAHRAAVEVVFVGTPPVGEPRHDAYRALASIAAALPKPANCIGVGFADHGTFDAVPNPLMLSQFKDPLNAMEPESVLRLFAAKASTFDVHTLVAALSREFGVKFSAGEYGTANSVRGGERYASAQVGDLDVSIRWREKYQFSRQRISGYTDAAVQRLLRQHDAVLEIRATGPAGEVVEAARHRVLARIAAALERRPHWPELALQSDGRPGDEGNTGPPPQGRSDRGDHRQADKPHDRAIAHGRQLAARGRRLRAARRRGVHRSSRRRPATRARA